MGRVYHGRRKTDLPRVTDAIIRADPVSGDMNMARWRFLGGLMAAWFVLLTPLSAGEASSARPQVSPPQPSPLRPVLDFKNF